MKKIWTFAISAVLVTLIISLSAGCKQESTNQFFGQWALYLPGGAGWLDLHIETDMDGNEYPVADLLWYGGSVVKRDEKPVIMDDMCIVWRTRDADRQKDKDGNVTVRQKLIDRIELKLNGNDEIIGRMYESSRNGFGVNIVEFTGKRNPAPGKAPKLSALKFGEPVTLFNGKDLSGWKLMEEEKTSGWKVVDGTLVNDPVQKEGEPHIRYGNLRTEAEFEDFNLKLEVNVPAHSNSGIYLRGIYEVQVVDSYGKDLDSHNMGGLYSRITPSVAAEKPAGEWQTFDITLCDRHLTVLLNGTKVIDNAPVYGCTGGAMTPNEFVPGPIYLQGDHGKVSYRNIVLTPIVK